MNDQIISDTDIAIVGMSSRLPGSKNTDEFWRNLRDGAECISETSDDQLRAELLKSLGYIPETTLALWLNDPNYIKAAAGLEDIDLFDATFFGYNPTEAELLDPQQRLFLECAWEALEDAAYDPETYKGLVGVYAGSETSMYHHNLHASILPSERDILALVGNTSDYLATRVSYKLNLKGPSIAVQTACSTSLVAIHMACQSLKNGECDMALAGGVAAYSIQQGGYLYQEGGMVSPDGHCRPFDAQAQGTVFANGGVGVIVLKRLTDALADGDNVYAVIKGSAINNDGSFKTGYTAPSIRGQTKVILEAMAVADVDPDSISYIEAHGTATPLGDPVEVAALTQAFRTKTQKKQFCAIGSVKSNLGHLGVAAGVAGLIKTTLALKHRMIPASLHYEQPNPQIDFTNSPFYVNNRLATWDTDALPRRAGVSSFGIGGTNAHAVLEEAPTLDSSSASRSRQLLILSAKTGSALDKMRVNLLDHLKSHPDLDLANLAFTLQVGRKAFSHRLMLVCQTVAEAVSQLEAKQCFLSVADAGEYPVAFMFPGQGSQYVNMGRELYAEDMIFREQVDRCAKFLVPYLQCDLREVIYPPVGQEETAREQLDQTALTQPALFVIEYALAQLWMNRGIHAQAMIGHSIGEYVAACLAGVFSLEDALFLVALRGRLMQQLPGGSMLAISLPEKDIRAFLDSRLSLAAHNSTTDCVVSGPANAIEQLERHLTEKNIPCRRLHGSHAFHSQIMDSILERFTSEVKNLRLYPPALPYLSNLTGTWITEQEATDPSYWAKHLRHTVRFAEGAQILLNDPGVVLLEIGPGSSLTTLARRMATADRLILPSLRHPQAPVSDNAFLLNTCGQLWCAGVAINWSQLYAGEQRRRIPLPTYPFERERYWIFPQRQSHQDSSPMQVGKKPDIADWFSIPSWKRSFLPGVKASAEQSERKHCWLVFTDTVGLGARIINHLQQREDVVITVTVGTEFRKENNREYCLRPKSREDYEMLLKEVDTLGIFPTHVVHFWTMIATDQIPSGLEFYETAQELGFYSLLFLTQALGEQKSEQPIQLAVVSNNLQEVVGGEILCPVRATALGIGKAVSYEYLHITFRNIDVVLPESEFAQEKLADQIVAELRTQSSDVTAAPPLGVAYRGPHRWVQYVDPVRLEAGAEEKLRLRPQGVYLITGGLGGIGLALAEYLARTVRARLVLTGRTALPVREEWDHRLATAKENEAVISKIRQIERLEELGAEVLVLNADVTDLKQMQAVISQIYEHFGELHGVIHSAGIAGGGMIPQRTSEEAATVLAPKIKGTLVLETVLKETHLDFIVLCSSLYSIIGGPGQADYCAANAFLDSFAFYNTAQSRTPTISINWDGWQEVGMAVNALATYKRPHPYPTSQAEIITIDHPLLTRALIETSGEEIYSTELDVAKDWVLNEHKIQDTSVLSATACLEIVRAAFEMHIGSKSMEISDICFFTPLTVEEKEAREVRCIFKQDDNNIRFFIKSRSANSEASDWLSHAEGNIDRLRGKAWETYDISSLKRKMAVFSPSEVERKNKEASMHRGPRWDVLKEVYFQADEGLAILELAEEFSVDLQKLHLHPALLDIATGFAAYYQIMAPGVAYLPFSYKRLSILDALPRRCVSYARSKTNGQSQRDNQEFLQYDIAIMDEYGRLLVEIEDFTLRRVYTDALHLQPMTLQKVISERIYPINNDNAPRQPSTEEQKNLQKCILPREGIEAFRRIISSENLPQVIVSARDIQPLLKGTGPLPVLFDLEVPEQVEASALHQRPDLQAAYVPPRNETEQQIAVIWQKVLGIEKVGIQDNFFEAGGDSLTGIRIINQLRNVFAVSLSMHLLFNTPTIEGLAEVIRQKQIEPLGNE